MLEIINTELNDEVALISEFEIISYEKLRKAVEQLSKKFKKGSINLLLCTNSVESVIIYLSLLKSGAIPLLLSSDLDLEFLIDFAKRYKVKTIISNKNFELNSIVDSWNFGKFNIYELGASKSLKDSKLSLLLTTSGSTGNPKVIRLSSKNIISNTKSICEYLKIKKSDRHITTLPMNYTYGLSCINTFLFSGASILLNNYSLFERDFWNIVKKFRPNSISGVPYTYEILYRIGLEKLKSTSFKIFTQAGGKLDIKILEAFSEFCSNNGGLFYVMYGQTEATARMSYLPPNMLSTKIGSIGIPIPGGHFELKKEKISSELFEDKDNVGELIFKGDNVALGYAKSFNELKNEDEFCSILKTGDIARIDEDNFVYILGRKNRYAKISGIRVSLVDIENILSNQNFKVAVVSDDKKLNVFVEGDYSETKIKNLKDHLIQKTTLSPSSFIIKFIKIIPRNENGKIKYSSLK